jgi:hypothetical protein
MSLIRSIRCASAPFDHRLKVGVGQLMLVDVKTGLRSPQRPLCAYQLSCPIGTIPVAPCAANLIRIAPVTSTTNGLNSNPHSTTPTPASRQTARGFLPRGLSDAYRRRR